MNRPRRRVDGSLDLDLYLGRAHALRAAFIAAWCEGLVERLARILLPGRR